MEESIPAKRILVADDQRDVLTALELLFKAQGISAVTVTSPEAILTAVSREDFDAVLMDLNYTRDTTSGEEGLDALSRLAALPNAPPVIVMTAWGSIELAVEAMKRGARDFVTKPWDNRVLLATITRNTERTSARYASNELEVASQVQRKLWPPDCLTFSSLAVAGHCRPIGAVGGDTFDFIELGNGRVAFSLADVSGKGLPAALMMASLQAILRSGVGHGGSDLSGFLQVANRHFFESTEPQHYATLFFGVYDDLSRELHYASCGHPPAILLSNDGLYRKLGSTASAFGMFEELTPEVESVEMRRGDALLVYSDGLLEARSPAGDELGEDRLVEIARELLTETDLPVPSFPARLVEDVVVRLGYQQTDDVTLVAARGI
ncbi:MAG: PP2C family protein-serine/threonine phosphatase [Vicinamibacteria bacterium]